MSDAGDATPRQGWLGRLRDGLSRSGEKVSGSIGGLFTKARLDDDVLEQIEEALIEADIGVAMAAEVCAELAKDRYDKDITPDEIKAVLAAKVEALLQPLAVPLDVTAFPRPHVVLVVGVNGSGKTTTIAKLAHLYKELDYSVLLAAGDTFRAAAVEQLKVWGERIGARVIARETGADAAGLAYDAFYEAREKGVDCILIDTAGRLQNKKDLMDELAKIKRVMGRLDERAPHDVVLVLDATTGQNALAQIEVFQDIAGVSGLVMTKLDGTARGGILVAAAKKFGLPIHAIGVGEKLGDLRPFNARDFARALAGLPAESDEGR